MLIIDKTKFLKQRISDLKYYLIIEIWKIIKWMCFKIFFQKHIINLHSTKKKYKD